MSRKTKKWNPFDDDPVPTEEDLKERELNSKPPLDVSTWCICNRCSNMPSQVESICCHHYESVKSKISNENRCILDEESLKNILTKDILMINLLSLKDNGFVKFKGSIPPNALYRHMGYRAFTYYYHGIQARRKRIPIPSCVVNYIRKEYPCQNEDYTGFRY